MKFRKKWRLSSLFFWIIPVATVSVLWIFIWLIWPLFFTDLSQDNNLAKVEIPDSRYAIPFYQLHQVECDVRIRDYFTYIEELALRYDRLHFYPIDEHLLVRANPWLIDTLAATDYYLRKERGELVFDQEELIVLYRGDLLRIPDSATVCAIQDEMGYTLIDLNIPAYTMQVKIRGKVVHDMSVRVGRYQRKYLAMAKGVVDLRTKTGYGKIVRINKDPDYINPSNNRPYDQTRRDDGRYTRLPRIPFLEPELDRHRWGQLIHPTTNIETLGRAYSNGCIGTSESDAWRLYYYAPIGTAILIRYDLIDYDQEGNRRLYRDIYGWDRQGA